MALQIVFKKKAKLKLFNPFRPIIFEVNVNFFLINLHLQYSNYHICQFL